jgi:hypothetical protein
MGFEARSVEVPREQLLGFMTANHDLYLFQIFRPSKLWDLHHHNEDNLTSEGHYFLGT